MAKAKTASKTKSTVAPKSRLLNASKFSGKQLLLLAVPVVAVGVYMVAQTLAAASIIGGAYYRNDGSRISGVKLELKCNGGYGNAFKTTGTYGYTTFYPATGQSCIMYNHTSAIYHQGKWVYRNGTNTGWFGVRSGAQYWFQFYR